MTTIGIIGGQWRTRCESKTAIQCQVEAATGDAILRSSSRHYPAWLNALLTFIEMKDQSCECCKIAVCETVRISRTSCCFGAAPS
eukprot:6193253-Pleurochrysis_carterae.AAC.1